MATASRIWSNAARCGSLLLCVRKTSVNQKHFTQATTAAKMKMAATTPERLIFMCGSETG
jgi:hypothetical protein